MSPDRVVERFMIAAAPLITLPGRNRSLEYMFVPKRVSTGLVKSPVVYIHDPAGFIDPKELARDVVLQVSTSFTLESRGAARAGNAAWAAALTKMAQEVERNLAVQVEAITSPKSNEKGWRVSSRPAVKALWHRAEELARED